MTERGRSKVRVGLVVSNKMDRTAVVKVESRKRHPRFHKYMVRSTKYLVHDEQNQMGVGDKVRIIETRSLSKRKNWRLLSIEEKSR
jgi:small subunit ribosomal protein S17